MSEDTDQNPKEGFFQKLNYLRIGLGARVREEVPKAVGKRIGDVASKVSGAVA
ncbi:MAG: hypothetical protein GW780_01485, partial [Candidatus Aenigmarchaeota archaeon]|nr:hypothetical protein [Candidatus Aenigmarchaeota archaeon]